MNGQVSTMCAVREHGERSVLGWARRFLVAAVIAAAVLAVGAVVTPSSAEAAVSSCGEGRCTLYLSKSETRTLADGAVPSPPAAIPSQLRAAYYALAYGHRWFAQQYADRGWCSGFRLSIYPWESQGYFGYACDWE